MAKTRDELSSNIAITSPAIARLLKHYRWYIQEQISDIEPIMTLQDYYFFLVRSREINKSRIFEEYLRKLQEKTNGN